VEETSPVFSPRTRLSDQEHGTLLACEAYDLLPCASQQLGPAHQATDACPGFGHLSKTLELVELSGLQHASQDQRVRFLGAIGRDDFEDARPKGLFRFFATQISHRDHDDLRTKTQCPRGQVHPRGRERLMDRGQNRDGPGSKEFESLPDPLNDRHLRLHGREGNPEALLDMGREIYQ